MTRETLFEAMGCIDDFCCEDFLVRTKSGAEYIGTPYDAEQFSDYGKETEISKFEGYLALYKREEGILFIDADSIESVHVRKPDFKKAYGTTE